ncbi:MAG: SLC13 family permease [Candidatus Marinimicrobia bacterium]|nr:SLC13 family permease [Candidatus Neomarinimicrobiota bacterium]MBL7023705.1 SLC13 family permease [Candidatus Neomarinimicrobiota bacterium]
MPLEVTALGAMGILLLVSKVFPDINILTIDEAVSGFSNKAVITIGAIFIMSRSLVKTGFLEVFADAIYQSIGNRKWLTITIFLVTVSIISGFINNTAAVAIFIPLAINLCQKFHISPTKLLLPLSYAAIFGGTLTLIGTSTNLVVSSLMETEGLQPFRMFEFAKLGLIFLVVGTIYNLIISRWMLPSRSIISSLTRKYHMGRYLTEFKVDADSPMIGKYYKEIPLDEDFNFNVLMVIRDDFRFRNNISSMVIQEGDVFLARINVKDIMRFKDEMKFLLLSDVKMTQQELSGKNHVVVEGIVSQYSSMVGKTLKEVDFRNRFSGFVLAIKRQREILREKIAHIKLKFSDTLLILVPRDKLEDLRSNKDVIVLEELNICLKYERYWWLSILVIPLIMILASFGIIDIMTGAVLGAILLLVLRSLSIQDAYDSINWSVIFLLAALMPFGYALKNTQADLLIGDLIFRLGGFFSGGETNLLVYLSLIYFISFFFTAFISNVAIGVIMVPFAITLAGKLGVDPRPFLVAIAFGASTCFMTPVGYQTNLMVFAPGQYRFMDFVKTGLPLTLIFWVIATILIPIYWPFSG